MMKEYPTIDNFFANDSVKTVSESQEQKVVEYMSSVTANVVNSEYQSMVQASKLVLNC